ncbi:transposase [Adlercreutzia sp. ZJ154]|uniref:transposase n=1 Tax=Adlercreutzia sp. ZJ154 TaxID=2709790 RepID=UPI0013E9D211|nr:transposase [Adlercreutzia sp. ZJ154]
MNEEFVRRIYDTLVSEGCEEYKTLFEKTAITDQTIEYWKRAICFFQGFDNSQKDIFYDILRQTIIDTISGVFGVFDGSTALIGGNMECSIQIDGVDTESELQDTFMEFVEDSE